MMTLAQFYAQLPMTETTLRKRLENGYYRPFELRNDLGHPCEYRVVLAGRELGVVKYFRGRRLVCCEKEENP